MAGKANYLGTDRRKGTRRNKNDRRGEVRWDKDNKDDRRQTFGRRKQDQTWRLPKK